MTVTPEESRRLPVLGLVERVWMTSPHAQMIVASLYCGWIFSFIVFSFESSVVSRQSSVLAFADD